MNNWDIGIRAFIDKPYSAVRQGYKPSVLDCWAISASVIFVVFKGLFSHALDITDFFDMTIREIGEWFMYLCLKLIVASTYPFTFWAWGTLIYFLLRNEAKTHHARSEKLSNLI